MKKEEYRVSKFLTVSFLLSKERLREVLEGFFCVPTGSFAEPVDRETLLEEYEAYIQGGRMRSYLLTRDPDCVYALEVRPGKRLWYPRRPVLQLREHAYTITADRRIQSGVFGPAAIPFGVTISYPQIFYDKGIIETLKTDTPNTQAFQELRRWTRHNTKPARIDTVNATFRVEV